MSSEGVLYLVDPFHLSRSPRINATKRAARRALARCQNGQVVWIEKFSSQAVKAWTRPLDFLFLDGDHSESAVRQDWNDWHRFVVPGGVVVFHDARIFPGGWPQPDWGTVKVVDAFFRHRAGLAWTIAEEVDSLVVAQRNR
jgi:predicted O-methyltransferase YrrM